MEHMAYINVCFSNNICEFYNYSMSTCEMRCVIVVKVGLRWLIQRDLAVIPKSNSVEHQRENISVSYTHHCRVVLCLFRCSFVYSKIICSRASVIMNI